MNRARTLVLGAFTALLLAGLIDLGRALWRGDDPDARARSARAGPVEAGPGAEEGVSKAPPSASQAESASPPPVPAPAGSLGSPAPLPLPGFAGDRPAAEPRVGRDEIAHRIRRELSRASMRGARASLYVRSLSTGEVLFAHDADVALCPASNAKLMTTASALVHLGPDFRFTTRVQGAGKVSDGVLRGDLWVVGDGDPDPIGGEHEGLLERICDAVASAGIREVEGALVVDDRVFDRRYVAPGWNPASLHKDYCAPVSGFSIHENCLRISVTPTREGEPARVEVYPDVPSFAPKVEITTGARGSKNLVDALAPVSPGSLVVRGSTPAGSRPAPVYVPVLEPPVAAARVLKDALAARGVRIRGEARVAGQRESLPGGDTIAEVTTRLGPVLARMNRESVNTLAEHLYKRAGTAREGLGTFESGGRATLAALDVLGVDREEAQSVDGSGLSRGNRFSARQIAGALEALYARPRARAALVASLARMGEDGTVSRRLAEDGYRGRAIAKSGYIREVSALSGFAEPESGEVIVFSIVQNGFSTRAAEMKKIQDRIVAALLELRPPGGEG